MTQPIPSEQPPEIRRHNAILGAKQLLDRSHNVNAEHSSALALQGILVLLIEYFEGQGDSPESSDPMAQYKVPAGLPPGAPPLPTWGVMP